MIVHVDMDAFYASVEIRDHPELRGKPVVVGGSPNGRGVVSAASYEARKFGIHSAMPSAKVLRQCPDAIFVKPRMKHYAEISHQIREIFERFTSLIEPLALDEAFLDVGGSERLFGDAVSIAKQIKELIRTELGLVASAGVAPNKYLAKVASDLEKPDGLVVVDPDHVFQFLNPLPISCIWGVGKKCLQRFHSIGVKTIGELRSLTVANMKPLFGINSQHFWNLARGIDDRSVVPDRVAKSMSHESTFHQDICQRSTLEAWLIELMGQVGRRLRRYDIRTRTVQVKVRFSDFQTITRAITLTEPTDVTSELIKAGSELLCQNLDPTHEPVRLLGAGAHNLVRREKYQQLLFEQTDQKKQKNLDVVTDEIVSKFGHDAVRSGKVIAENVRGRTEFPNQDDLK